MLGVLFAYLNGSEREAAEVGGVKGVCLRMEGQSYLRKVWPPEAGEGPFNDGRWPKGCDTCAAATIVPLRRIALFHCDNCA